MVVVAVVVVVVVVVVVAMTDVVNLVGGGWGEQAWIKQYEQEFNKSTLTHQAKHHKRAMALFCSFVLICR